MATGNIAVRLGQQLQGDSPQKTNFTKLTRLLICGGTFALREVFDSKILPRDLNNTLRDSSVFKKLEDLRKKRIITQDQWNVMYPSSGVVVESKSFDISLLFKLLRNICDLTAPETGWNGRPNSTDTSLEADLVRIKYYRNKLYAHVNIVEMNDDEFENYWSEIKEAILRILSSINPSSRSDCERKLDECYTTSVAGDDDKNLMMLKIWCMEEEMAKNTTRMEEFNQQIKELRDAIQGIATTAIAYPEITTQAVIKLASRGVWLAGSAYILNRYKDDPDTFLKMVKGFVLPSGVLVYAMTEGSLRFHTRVETLDGLEQLWKRYQSGQLKQDLEKIFMTEEIKKLIGDQDIEFSVEIREEEIENARHTLLTAAAEEERKRKESAKEGLAQALQETKLTTDISMFHGDVVKDGENKWQAHLAVITSKDQAEQVLAELKKKDPSIAEATHNIWAYRIFNDEIKAHDKHCEDDGDDNFGARILQILQRTNATNVMVVVTCWYETTAEEVGEVRLMYIQKSVLDLLVTSGLEIQTSKVKRCFEEIKYKPFEKPKEQEIPKFDILHGETIEDRKSTFQAHLAGITSRAQADQVLVELKKNRKIAKAKYNMWACRVYDEKTKAYIEESYDDGENLGGGRLLHLLRRSDAKNVVIIVTRWHGGIPLGNDRFKHINKCASELLQQRSKRVEETATASTDPKQATKKKTRKSTKKI